MSNQPKKSTTENDIIGLRDQFADRARKAQQTARDLEVRAQEARREAERLIRDAQVMDQAYRLLMKENVLSSATAQMDDLGAKDFAKIAKRRFVFLIDGSGSMQGAPLEASLTAAQALAQKISAAGGAVESYMFGNKEPVKVDVTDEAQRQLMRKGLNCGTDIAPTIQKVSETLKKTQATHVVIFSDGDIFDKDPAKLAITGMFAKFPKATMDALQIDTRRPATTFYNDKTAAAYLADAGYDPRALQSSFPSSAANGRSNLEKFFVELSAETGGAHKPMFANVSGEAAPVVLGQILASRLQESAAKPAAKTTKKPSAPGK